MTDKPAIAGLDESWDEQEHFLIDVDGPAVTGRTISTTARTWEGFSVHPGAPRH